MKLTPPATATWVIALAFGEPLAGLVERGLEKWVHVVSRE
jgi:hypothetical protein